MSSKPKPVKIQWWPFSFRYVRRVRQYNSFCTGSRCSPAALVREPSGEHFASNILRAPKHKDDTWDVLAYHRKGMPTLTVSTDQIVDIECARVVAGYEC
ncbi:MAG: hypothetical protein AAGB04_30215 [Pseudomonadota bacterium]